VKLILISLLIVLVIMGGWVLLIPLLVWGMASVAMRLVVRTYLWSVDVKQQRRDAEFTP